MVGTGNTSQAQKIIEQQLQGARSLRNLMDAASVMHGQGQLHTKYRDEALSVAWKQVNNGQAQTSMPWVAIGTYSLQSNKRKDVLRARDELLKSHPDDGHGHYFDGIVKLQDGDWEGAESALLKARDLGIADESINEYLRMAIDGQKWIWEYALVILVGLAVWLVGLLVLYVVGKVFSAMTLRSIRKGVAETSSGFEKRLRSAYRVVVNVAGLYYYMSLPIVVIATIALPLAIGYALLMLPSVSLLLVAIVLIAGLVGLVTAVTGIRTAFIRASNDDPGKSLPEDEASELWQLARDVASDLDTRPLDEIWITPGTEVAVVERGGWWARRKNKAKRALILGAGLLDGFRVDAFRSVLAHEYGHFRNRDTAGGDIALYVRMAMMKFAERIMERGKIRWWDVAVHFLRIYHRLFMQLTFGASRLQEVLADRVAVKAYGASAFREGLSYVIRRSAEFDLMVSEAIGDRMTGKAQPVASFYPGPGVRVQSLDELHKHIDEVMQQPTTEKDTHPSPKDRFRMAEELGAVDRQVDDQKLIRLFAKPADLHAQMNEQMNEVAKEHAAANKTINTMILREIDRIMAVDPQPEAVIERARLRLQVGQHDRCAKELSKILSQFPEATMLRYGRAVAYHEMKQHGKASEDIDQYIRQFAEGQEADLFCTAAEYHLRADRPAKSREMINRALAADKNSLTARALRGRLFEGEGNYDKAITDYEYVLEQVPACTQLRKELAALRAHVAREAASPKLWD